MYKSHFYISFGVRGIKEIHKNYAKTEYENDFRVHVPENRTNKQTT